MRHVAFVLVLAFAVPVQAQDRLATTVFVGGALADTFTTFHNMRGGFTEADQLYAFARDKPIGTVISLAVTDAVTLWLAHRYHARHPRLVTIALFTLGGVRTANSIHNIAAWNAYANRPVFIPDPH